jgi:hypothetical protein
MFADVIVMGLVPLIDGVFHQLFVFVRAACNCLTADTVKIVTWFSSRAKEEKKKGRKEGRKERIAQAPT